MSNVWKMIQEKNFFSKHMQKKHNHIMVPSQIHQDYRHILQNPTLLNYVMGFSNCAQRFTGSIYLEYLDYLDVNKTESLTLLYYFFLI